MRNNTHLETFWRVSKPTYDKTPPDFEQVSKKAEQTQVIIDEKTGTIEWRTVEFTSREIEQLQRILGYKKPKTAHWNELRNKLAVGSIATVAEKNRGKKGYSVGELKAFSAALSKLK